MTCDICGSSTREPAEPAARVCFRCGNRLLRQLRELDQLLPTLSLQRRRVGAERGAPGFASHPPADDTTILHTDWRSRWDSPDGVGALAALHSWADHIRTDRNITHPSQHTLTSETSVLRTNHHWLTRQPYIADYARELAHIHAAIRAQAGDPIPRPLGQCIAIHTHGECTGTVYELDDATGARCGSCHRVYNGLDLIRFRAAQETP